MKVTDAIAAVPYGIDDAIEELFLERDEVERFLDIWAYKKNMILQGAPGVGKSFVARRLAYALIGFRDDTKLQTVQFHQSYSYEDFVQGYRPNGSQGFERKNGTFYEFRDRALRDLGATYVFIIDEINRGNLSKIFGELASCGDVEKALRHELRKSARRMVGVSPVRLSGDVFHRVQLSRNTSQYRFLMRVCELIFHSLLPDEQGSSSKFQNILEDEVRMSALFEDFLRNFYRTELPGYSAASEIMSWRAEAAHEADLAFLPIMKTDITLRSGKRTIVADAKYYGEVLAGGRYQPKVRSAHLYQLSTYLAHSHLKEPHQDLSGLLIYPAVGQELRLGYRLLGIPVLVATVDLSGEWRSIHDELLGLVAPVFNALDGGGGDGTGSRN